MLQQKIHQHLETGKLLRYEIPDYIKEVFEKATKFSKELKKVMSDRASLEKLEELNQIALTEHKIITNEMLQFEQSLIRCRDWLERVEPYYADKDKINLKNLSIYINEYKSLPIKCDRFEKKFKSVYEKSLELIEKIPNFSRISKTRGTNNQERISIEEALKVYQEIISLNTYCDEFDSFECALIINLEKINNLQMNLNDDKQVFTMDLLKQLMNDASDLNFDSNVQDQIQDLHSYFKLIEKVKKQINDPSKLHNLKDEILQGKERGFSSQELDQLENQIVKTIEWFKCFEKLRVEKKNITEKKFYNNFKIDQNEYKKIQILEDMKLQTQQLKIDDQSFKEFQEILSELQNWRENWIQFKSMSLNNQNNTLEDSKNNENINCSENIQMEIENTQTENLNEEKIINKSVQQLQIESFDELHKFIQKGLTIGIQTPELLESIEYYKRGISWTISSLGYINEYCGNQIKSDLLSDNLFNQLLDIFNKNKYENELNIKNKQNYEKLDIYLEFSRIPVFCYQSQQYGYLRSLKQIITITIFLLINLNKHLFEQVIVKRIQFHIIKYYNRNDVEKTEKEAQDIINLDLEELQCLDHFSVIDVIPKLDEKYKKLPINNHNIKKLWQIYVLQKWGREAHCAHKYINEEFKENRELQVLLKNEGIVEFSQIVDQLAQKLPTCDLQEFIDCCKQQWTQIYLKFSSLFDIIQKNPIKETHTLLESSQNSDQWTFQKIKTLLKNGQNFTLKNEFLKLYQDISSYIEQTDSWIDSFYTKTICKKIIITKDGKKITKKKGLNLDDFNLSPLLDKIPSNLESIPDISNFRQNSQNIEILDQKIDSINNQDDKNNDQIKEEETLENKQKENQEEKMEVENKQDQESNKNYQKNDQFDITNNDRIDCDLYKDTPQKFHSPLKDDIQDLDTKQEDESNMQEEKTENGPMKASAQKHGPKISKLLEESEYKQSKDAEKKLLKKSKINTFNYYLSYPMILITFYQGLIRDINNQEMIMAQNKMLDLIKYKTKAGELLKTKPTLEEMKSYIIRGESFNCFIPELSIMKKINKWANQWIAMARKILDSISKNKKNLNNTKVKNKDVLPIDFCEEKYILQFDVNNLCVTIVPRKKDHNQFQSRTIDFKKKVKENEVGFFDGDLESQINFLNNNKNEQIKESQGKNQISEQNIKTSIKNGPGRKASSIKATKSSSVPLKSQTHMLKQTEKRGIKNKFIKQNGILQQSIRPKRNSQLPKHYQQGQYHFDTPKLNPEVSNNSLSATHQIQNTKLTPVKPNKSKEPIMEKTKRKYVRKNQIEVEQPLLKKKRIISKDGIKQIVIDDVRGEANLKDRKIKKSQLKQQELLEANGIGEEVQQQIAQISQLHQHSHIQVIEEDENKAYCICRGYSGEESIGCDGCQDWFHFSCIGLKPQLGNVLKKYYCMGCCKRFNRTYLAGHKTEYIWDIMEKISIEQFNEIVKEGLSLNLQIKEIDQMLELKQKVDEQLLEMQTLIERGPDLLKIIELYEKAYKLECDYQDEQVEELRKQEEEKDKQLFQCYLAHFGFPIDFTQAEALLLLIQRRDFARQILRHLYSNKLSLIEQFFNQVSKLFDLNKILLEQSQDQFLFDHLKKIYENSVDVKSKLTQLGKRRADIEQYQALFQQIEKEYLIIPNIKDHKIVVEEYQKWQQDAQKLISSFSNINNNNKQHYAQELKDLTNRYDSRILIKSKLIITLNSIQQQFFQDSSNNKQNQENIIYVDDNKQNQFSHTQKNNQLLPPPYTQFQIQINKEKQMKNIQNQNNINNNQHQYIEEERLHSRSSLNSGVEFNLQQQDIISEFTQNINHLSGQNIMSDNSNNNNHHAAGAYSNEDDDDQIKSFVEDSDEQYGEDFEDEGYNYNQNNNINNILYQNAENNQIQIMQNEFENEKDEDEQEEDDEDDDQEEDDEGEDEDDDEDEEEQELNEEEQQEEDEEEEDLEENDLHMQEGQEDVNEDENDDEDEEEAEDDQDMEDDEEEQKEEDDDDDEEEEEENNENYVDHINEDNSNYIQNSNNQIEEDQDQFEEDQEEEDDDQDEELEEEEGGENEQTEEEEDEDEKEVYEDQDNKQQGDEIGYKNRQQIQNENIDLNRAPQELNGKTKSQSNPKNQQLITTQ